MDPNNWKITLHFPDLKLIGPGNVNYVSERRQEVENAGSKCGKWGSSSPHWVFPATSCTLQYPWLPTLPILLSGCIFLPTTYHSVTQCLLYISSSLLPSVFPTKCTPQGKGFGFVSFTAVSPAVDDAHYIYNMFPGSSSGVCHLFQFKCQMVDISGFANHIVSIATT